MATPLAFNQSLFWLCSPLALLLLLVFPLYLLLTTLITSKKSRLPPSPLKLPLIGNLHQVGSLPHRTFRDLASKYGPLMLLDLGQVPALVVSSADMAMEITRTHDTVFASRPSSKLADTLLYGCSDMGFAPLGEYWRQVRKITVTHLLSAKMVQSFRLARESEVRSMIDKVARSAGAVVDMSGVLNSLSNDIICRAVSRKYFSDGRSYRFKELIDESTAMLGGFHFGDYFPRLGWVDKLSGLERRARRNFERWDGVLEAVIKEHVERGEDGGDFVDVLLALQKDPSITFALSNEHIKALLTDIFAAGTDTSYVTLEWCLTELVRNPDIMEKLQDEVRSIANGKAMVRDEDLREMNYLKATLKETLRLHVPVPLLLPRESLEDCRIGGYEIPEKTRVFINVWAIARDPNLWEVPEEFRPERFLNSPVDFKGNDFQLLPFGAGRRICPGMHFALVNMELALANLVHRFDWELPKGMVREDMDMIETPGLTAGRKQRLHLVPKPYSS